MRTVEYEHEMVASAKYCVATACVAVVTEYSLPSWEVVEEKRGIYSWTFTALSEGIESQTVYVTRFYTGTENWIQAQNAWQTFCRMCRSDCPALQIPRETLTCRNS
jgi:hypothetical protein